MRSRELMFVLMLALVPTAMASTTWYVNGNAVSASDSNNCTSRTTPCKTIGHAISLASSGDTIQVAAATYVENLSVNISLMILGSGAKATIIDGGGVKTVVNISNNSAHVTLSGLTIRNGAAMFGGGIYNSGTLIVTASIISGNTASCSSHDISCSAAGGGIYNSAGLTISKSTLSGNTAKASCSPNPCVSSADGGGIYNHFGTTFVSNSTLAGNTASKTFSVGGFAAGGAISNRGVASISNSTFAGNSATHFGGAINNYVGYSVTLQNSIVANNSPANCAGTSSNGYNLSSDSTCNFTNTGDLNNTNPQLGPLQNNGGPTQTMALLSGSPAIDAGNPNGCTDGLGHLLKTDQRGKPRPDTEDTAEGKLGCDMGAFELQNLTD